MRHLVIDASTTLSWLMPDEDSNLEKYILDSNEALTFLVPSLWVFEVANGLLVAERKGRVSEAQSGKLLEQLNTFVVEVQESLNFYFAFSVLDFARFHNLTTYDAAYLQLALRVGCPLITSDIVLSKAAKNSGVEVIN